jgi:hypothetical protein
MIFAAFTIELKTEQSSEGSEYLSSSRYQVVKRLYIERLSTYLIAIIHSPLTEVIA